MTRIKRITTNTSLSVLRDELLDNTMVILSALMKRQDLLREVAIIKHNNELSIRDRKRELVVMKSFDTTLSWISPILNVIFEFSVITQKQINLTLPWKKLTSGGVEFLSLKGDIEIIFFLTGIILGRFGKLVYTTKSLPHNLELGFAFTGSHIVNDLPPHDIPKLKINSGLGKNFATLSLNGDGTIIIPKSEMQTFMDEDLEVIS